MLKPNFRAYLSVINTMTELHFAETVVPKQLSPKSRVAFVFIEQRWELAVCLLHFITGNIIAFQVIGRFCFICRFDFRIGLFFDHSSCFISCGLD